MNDEEYPVVVTGQNRERVYLGFNVSDDPALADLQGTVLLDDDDHIGTNIFLFAHKQKNLGRTQNVRIKDPSMVRELTSLEKIEWEHVAELAVIAKEMALGYATNQALDTLSKR